MTMGAILEETRDRIRVLYSFGKDQCDITIGGRPRDSCGELFIGVDEAGVDPLGDSQKNHFAGEEHRISIGIWRRAGQYGEDRSGHALLSDDPYLAGIQTLDDIERKVYVAIHMNQELRQAVNVRLSVPSTKGDSVTTPLAYGGRTKTQSENVNDGGSGSGPWFFRIMRFTGMKRVQSLQIMG